MTFRKIVSFILVIVAISFSINVHSQELIPLKVNNTWKYLKKETTNGTTIVKDTVLSKVEKILNYNNKKWFFLNELSDKYIVRNDEQGQYELDTLHTIDNGNFKEVLMFKKNPSLKQATYIAYEDIEVTIASGTFMIKTEMGNFECIKYSLISQEAEETEPIEFYIKPGIGLIYHKWIENGITTTYELIEYHIN